MLALSLLKGVGCQPNPSRSWGFSLDAPACRPREGERGVMTAWGGEMPGPWLMLLVQPWDQSQWLLPAPLRLPWPSNHLDDSQHWGLHRSLD